MSKDSRILPARPIKFNRNLEEMAKICSVFYEVSLALFLSSAACWFSLVILAITAESTASESRTFASSGLVVMRRAKFSRALQKRAMYWSEVPVSLSRFLNRIVKMNSRARVFSPTVKRFVKIILNYSLMLS